MLTEIDHPDPNNHPAPTSTSGSPDSGTDTSTNTNTSFHPGDTILSETLWSGSTAHSGPTSTWQYELPYSAPPSTLSAITRTYTHTHTQPYLLPDTNTVEPNSYHNQIVQTPNTATTIWSQPSAVEPTFIPPPPPNTASAGADTNFGTMPFGAPYTGLSPMFSTFSTASPMQTSFSRPVGPIRGYSTSAALSGGRKRSSTLATTTLSSALYEPLSPNTSYSSMYPYPSPHAAFPFSPGRQSDPQIRRVFHPSPSADAQAIGVELSSPAQDIEKKTSQGVRATMAVEGKQPRFKPTKEQLDVLIAVYQTNKNPDGPTREALVKQLGGEIKQKTLQIWFQNRRSKAKAKERDANLPKPIQTRGGASLSQSTPAPSRSVSTIVEVLRPLVHNNDRHLAILPIKVLAIANWTRFLTPGTTQPDLAAAIRYSQSPTLYLYVMHKSETFRIDIPLDQGSISNIQAASNPNFNVGSIAIRFELEAQAARYNTWLGDWIPVVDFTGGEAEGGGRCELTGDRETLLPAFAHVKQLLTKNLAFPGQKSHQRRLPTVTPGQTPALHLTPTGSDSDGMTAAVPLRRRSFSQPPLFVEPPLLIQPIHSASLGSSASGSPLESLGGSWATSNTPGLIIPQLSGTITPQTGAGDNWGLPMTTSTSTTSTIPTPLTSNTNTNVSIGIPLEHNFTPGITTNDVFEMSSLGIATDPNQVGANELSRDQVALGVGLGVPTGLGVENSDKELYTDSEV